MARTELQASLASWEGSIPAPVVYWLQDAKFKTRFRVPVTENAIKMELATVVESTKQIAVAQASLVLRACEAEADLKVARVLIAETCCALENLLYLGDNIQRLGGQVGRQDKAARNSVEVGQETAATEAVQHPLPTPGIDYIM